MKLNIKNFKCFENSSIELKPLTILVGANGVGKSSVIQSFLLLRETLELRKQNVEKISLNGPFGLSLGSSSGLVNQNMDSDTIEFSIKDCEKKYVSANYSIDSDNDQLWIKCNDITGGWLLDKKEFYYLTAERIGPRISQQLKNLDYLQTGVYGEFTAQTIGEESGQIKISPSRMRKEQKDPRLESQVNAWLDFILPGVSVRANNDINSMIAQLRIRNSFTQVQPVISPNIGFGITYVLPIITTGLVAVNDSIFIVENPESHLHPAAQSAIGQFIAFLADNGLHVIVETHSDHVINGIQIYTAKHSDFFNKVVINNFSIDGQLDQPLVNPITINRIGEISEWPKGFLDQSRNDYIKLLKARTNV